MFFHFVKKGDNLYDLSKKYDVDLQTIINNNSLINPEDLVVNQCLLINDGMNNNNRNSKVFNGYAYEFSSIKSVERALPYLTYLSIFSYRVNENGDIDNINDDKLISLAKQYDVKPIMVITNSKIKGGFSPDIASDILNNQNKINYLFENIEKILKEKKYYGLNIDFEYIKPSDKEKFIDFIRQADKYFRTKKYYLSIALAPKNSDEQKGLLYESHDYEKLSNYVDNVILMTYEWGYTYGPAMAVAPVNEVKKVLDYATSKMEPNKIIMGIPNYGYDFIVPYVKNQKAKSITNPQAIVIAYENHASIKRNKLSMTPYFTYKNEGKDHEVHFDDPCSIEGKLSLIDDYGIAGGSIWTISNYLEYIYLLINNGYLVKK